MTRNMKCSTSGKDVHFTADAADRAILSYSKRGLCITLRRYRCPSCQWWHLTKQAAIRPQREERV